jgi:DNA-binding response OmpR family regulator
MNNNGPMETNQRLKIILLEANSVLRHVYETFIRDCYPDVELLIFDNGYEAWKEILRFRPHLLVTDDSHEGLHGSVIVTWMTTKWADCPVLWTTPGSVHDLPKLFGGLKYEILPKPVKRNEFLERLNRLVPQK